MTITYKTNPPLTSADLNALFSAGRDALETSNWQPVIEHSLVYLCAYDDERLTGLIVRNLHQRILDRQQAAAAKPG